MAINAWREKRASFESEQARCLAGHERNEAGGDSATQSDILDGRSRYDLHGEQPTQPNRLRYQGVLSVIMLSLKGYTARKCDIELGRSGGFWQHESFGHVIDDEDEFNRTVRYVLKNPVKAGLAKHWREWPWSYCRPALLELLEPR